MFSKKIIFYGVKQKYFHVFKPKYFHVVQEKYFHVFKTKYFPCLASSRAGAVEQQGNISHNLVKNLPSTNFHCSPQISKKLLSFFSNFKELCALECVTCNFFWYLSCFKQGWMYVTPRNNKYLGLGCFMLLIAS